jgi:alkanesulfonate monooxygenase SsuD/methylene tetrahydromethanopterin reductase-like flavin-dependent oxidoreductase (luciferase family)
VTYGHPLLFGSFLTPGAASPDTTVALAQLCEQVGYDLVTFQDHPYQPAFLDTWTLLSYVAARTETVRLAPNVLNLPLRQPAVVARSAASLDLLSGGRFELGIGAGAFWDAIEAMGGRRLAAGQSVAALEEAIAIIRAVWDDRARGGVRVRGEHYQVVGAKRGPAPAHEIGVWIGAYQPRMLRLIGRVADGWLPSLSYLGAPERLAELNTIIDDSAAAAGRSGHQIRRLLNVSGEFTRDSGGLLHGPPEQWVDELSELATRYGISAFILGSDNPRTLQIFGEEVAPAVRELVVVTAEDRAAEPQPSPSPTPVLVSSPPAQQERLGITPTIDDGIRRSAQQLWDEATRPTSPAPEPGRDYTARGRAVGQHLIDVHDHLRTELTQLQGLVEQVRSGQAGVAAARSAVNEMTMRQNDWTLGAYCASYCRVVAGHHSMEDDGIFPHLRATDTRLAPVIDRLVDEHHVIHDVLERVDAGLVHLVAHPDDLSQLDEAVDLLADTLLSHLAYEEQQLVEPLARLGFYSGQV